MQTAIGADFWGGVNFLFWGGRISRDSTKRELIFFSFFFFFVYSKYSMAGSAENSARKKGGVVCTFFFFFFALSFPFSGACVSPSSSTFWWGKQVQSMQKNTQKFIHSWQEQSPAQMEGVHTATAQQQRGRYDTIRCSGYCSLCIRNIELRLHLLRTLVQITPSVPAPCKQKQLPIKSRAGSQALGDACRPRENMEYRVPSPKARRSNVAVTSKWKLPNKFLPC